MNKLSKKQVGLTLVEVMVALLILAGVSVSAMALVSQSSGFVALSEQRLVASIVADNAMLRELLSTRRTETGDDVEEIEASGQIWRVTKTIDDAGEEIYQVRISVGRAGEDRDLITIESLKAQ